MLNVKTRILLAVLCFLCIALLVTSLVLPVLCANAATDSDSASFDKDTTLGTFLRATGYSYYGSDKVYTFDFLSGMLRYVPLSGSATSVILAPISFKFSNDDASSKRFFSFTSLDSSSTQSAAVLVTRDFDNFLGTTSTWYRGYFDSATKLPVYSSAVTSSTSRYYYSRVNAFSGFSFNTNYSNFPTIAYGVDLIPYSITCTLLPVSGKKFVSDDLASVSGSMIGIYDFSISFLIGSRSYSSYDDFASGIVSYPFQLCYFVSGTSASISSFLLRPFGYQFNYSNTFDVTYTQYFFDLYSMYSMYSVGVSSYGQGFSDGYGSGYSDGEVAGYTDGKRDGIDEANSTVTDTSASYAAGVAKANNTLTKTSVSYTNGYQAGVSAAGNYTFGALFGAVFDAPVNAFKQFFNFEIFGVNLTGFLSALFVVAIVVTVVRLCLG